MLINDKSLAKKKFKVNRNISDMTIDLLRDDKYHVESRMDFKN